MNPLADPEVSTTARHFVGAVRAWLADRPPTDMQRAKNEHDLAVCTAMLEVLESPTTMPRNREWHCGVDQWFGPPADDGEWYSWTRTIEVTLRASGIVCNEYMNQATQMGAAQSPIRTVHSTSPSSEEQRQQLAAFRADLDAALQGPGVSIRAGRRDTA